MSRVKWSVEMDAPAATVWQTLADFGGIYRWAPAIKTTVITSDGPVGLGSTRHCELSPMGELDERIIGWEEGRLLRIHLFRYAGLPMRDGHITFEVAEVSPGRSRVTLTGDYEVAFGPLGPLADVLMVNRFASHGFRDMLAGLKRHVETGEQIRSTRGLPLAAVKAA